MKPTSRLSSALLESERLILEPLRPDHADELAPVLDDVALHRFIGGEPVGVDELRERYGRRSRGVSPDGSQRWLNWAVRARASGEAVGTVDATLPIDESATVAELGWMIGSAYQGQGFAKEAVGLVADWLRSRGVRCLRAHIHPQHETSMAVARSIGLVPTGALAEGEVRWEPSEEVVQELRPG